MRSRTPVIVGVIAVVAIIASVGVAYAAYNGNTYSEGNTMPVSEKTIDILKKDNEGNYSLLNKDIPMPEYNKGSSATITGYAVATSSNTGGFYVYCKMGSPSYWPLIKSMSINVNGGTIHFGVNGTNTGVPTPIDTPISMADGEEITVDGKTFYYYDFMIEIEFYDYDITDDRNFERLSSFEGSSFVFTYVDA